MGNFGLDDSVDSDCSGGIYLGELSSCAFPLNVCNVVVVVVDDVVMGVIIFLFDCLDLRL